MSALRDIGVLVTRPEPQALPLCRVLAGLGARTLLFPVIDIKPCAERRAIGARLAPIEQFNLIIFVSANAVRYGAGLLDEKRDLQLAAVGPATARALNQSGYRVAVLPAEGFDTEGLLAHPHLQRLEGQRVLLVKGAGGRELLADELRRRGARVTLAEVYARAPVNPGPADLAALQARFTAAEIDVITATSLEIGLHLLEIATPPLRDSFDRVHWLVPSARVAEGLRAHGLRAPLLVAASAEDQSLAEALTRWRSSVSGA